MRLAIFLSVLLTFPPVQAAEPPAVVRTKEATRILEEGNPEKYGAAAALYRKAVEDDASLAEAHIGLAYARLLQYLAKPGGGKEGLEEALIHLEKAYRLKPLPADAWRRKSTVLYHLGRTDEGLRALEEGLATLPQAVELYGAKLAYLVNIGRKEEAVVFVTSESLPARDERRLLYHFGEVWYDLGEYFQARVCFTRSIDVRETAEAHEMIGRTFVGEEKWKEAAEAFQWALNAEPDYYELYQDVALAHAQLGETKEAIRWLDAYTSNFPDDLVAQKDLALLYEKIGQKVKARLLWMKIRSGAAEAKDRDFASKRIEMLKRKK